MRVDLDSPYRLSKEQIATFRKNGFIKLKELLSAATLAHYGNTITELVLRLNTQHLPLAARSTYYKAFLQVKNLWEISKPAREFVMCPRLARVAAQLLEVDGVRLYHDQALYKEPGGGITPAHADQYYWPLASDRSITAWIPLQPVARPMGPLAFFAGSQAVSFGRDLAISDDSESKITANMTKHEFPIVEEPFDLGEVSFHLGWTFHRAGANTTDRPRAVMTIIYMDRDMRLLERCNDIQTKDWARWCPGAEPGQIITTSLNPLVYSA